MVERADIPSGNGPYYSFPGYETVYPKVVIEALAKLYVEYNKAFASLVSANREWPDDYQYCMIDGRPTNFAVQIDMAGLTDLFLERAGKLSVDEMVKLLRFQIFEIENSVAVYSLLRKLFPKGSHLSRFESNFDAVLNGIKKRFGRKPVALLAVTPDKYRAICVSEFGIIGRDPTDEEVKALSGFDRLFSPDAFLRHLRENDGNCKYLLYVRSSDPIAKLKDPSAAVDQPLLGNDEVRRVIKAHTITMNVDAPDMRYDRRINNTKAYMWRMGMAHPIEDVDDLYGLPFQWFLQGRGIDPAHVMRGTIPLRAKPLKGTYGCYGHVVDWMDTGFPRKLRHEMNGRGGYVVQPELPAHIVHNTDDDSQYYVIDRIFFGIIKGGEPIFLQGFRSMMPIDSTEGRKGRNHGNVKTVWAPVSDGS